MNHIDKHPALKDIPNWNGVLLWKSKLVGILFVIIIVCAPQYNVRAVNLTENQHDGLSWDKNRLEFEVDHLGGVVSGKFIFRNISSSDVTISQLEPSCGCLKAATNKATYLPGESGTLSVTMAANVVGVTERDLIVETTPGVSPMKLTVVITAGDSLSISPPNASWKKGASTIEREITISAKQGKSFKVLGLRTTDPVIWPELRKMVIGKKYVIAITPGSTDEQIQAAVRVEIQFADGARRFYQIPTDIDP